jgi:hypothetical protein
MLVGFTSTFRRKNLCETQYNPSLSALSLQTVPQLLLSDTISQCDQVLPHLLQLPIISNLSNPLHLVLQYILCPLDPGLYRAHASMKRQSDRLRGIHGTMQDIVIIEHSLSSLESYHLFTAYVSSRVFKSHSTLLFSPWPAMGTWNHQKTLVVVKCRVPLRTKLWSLEKFYFLVLRSLWRYLIAMPGEGEWCFGWIHQEVKKLWTRLT